jgi:hypothetical protein
METPNHSYEVPTWLAGVVVALVLFIAAYVLVYGGSLSGPLVAIFGLIGIGLSAFTVYLLYRFVVAVEKIADKL